MIDKIIMNGKILERAEYIKQNLEELSNKLIENYPDVWNTIVDKRMVDDEDDE